MKRSWSPVDLFRSAARGEIYGRQLVDAAISVPHRRPYSVTQLRNLVTDESQQLAVDQVSAAESDDEVHPERRRMRAEAVLLMAKTPLSPRKLAQMAHLADATEARTLVRQLNHTYETLGRAIRVEQVAGGFRMMTRPFLAPWLARLGHLPQIERLSTPMMETLAVVAYRQPVSRASAEGVRGVTCGELLRQLMERDLIRIVGRSEELGRPYLYGTTKHFLQHYGLPRVDALPPIQWHALQEDPIDEEVSPENHPEDSSTFTKEAVVITTIAPASIDAKLDETTLSASESDQRVVPISTASPSPLAVDEDAAEEGDDNDWDEDDDWDDEEDWDDDEADEEELDEKEVDEEEVEEIEDGDELDEENDFEDDDLDEEGEEAESESEDDLDEDDWEEVDDEDEELEDDDEEDDEWEEDEGDESAEDDEDWE